MEQTRHAGLFTRRFGPPPHEGAPSVVLVHGLGISGRYFVPLARRLAAGGASVLVPDLPGTARSRAAARRAPGIGAVADAVAHWHRRLSLGPCLFVGNSVGCQVIAAVAARHPRLVRGAVLIGPALEPGASGWRQAGQLLADAPREPLSLLGVAMADYLLTGPLRFAVSFRHALRDAAGAFEANLSRVRAPTLVVRGAADPVASGAWARRVARTVADGRVAEVRGAAHAAHYSAPDAVAALIGAFTAGRRG
ncbi:MULTISPECIES: alpha/beta fold hydrolase [Streptomyces]|uniref:Alpha/beta hydrolase n=1 Tax=Streptomyces sudanensis TaxID=436397 RepID=A0ABY4TND1_9ACTN|nr:MULTISPECIES: alpha/beta hydrolase [Streptomyces]URN18475.1 alpha/beta hydrolase [Streptomyces sudanensis]